jgi:hypothetical protein
LRENWKDADPKMRGRRLLRRLELVPRHELAAVAFGVVLADLDAAIRPPEDGTRAKRKDNARPVQFGLEADGAGSNRSGVHQAAQRQKE